MSLLRVIDLDKTWNGQPVLAGIRFAVAAGEFVAVVGRSGSGKSTLLHLIAGIDRPDRGQILLDGRDVAALDVLDNLRLPLELRGVSAASARGEAQAMLAALDLAALSARDVATLSGGEQQRVAVARALVHRPVLVLADEPTASLDADNAAVVLDLLQAACRERGAALLMATHAQEVMGRAQRLLRIVGGRLQDDACVS